jgi:hypothetical protein
MTAISDAMALIAALQPELDPETYCFVTMPEGYRSGQLGGIALASFREEEGMSFVLPLAAAQAMYLSSDLPQRRIVLNVLSALDGVGLTAAVSGALAEAGIACNCVAAFHHDHIFVPERDAAAAMECLKALQASVRGG